MVIANAWSVRELFWGTWIATLAIVAFGAFAAPILWIRKQWVLDRKRGGTSTLASLIGNAFATSVLVFALCVLVVFAFGEAAKLVNRSIVPLVPLGSVEGVGGVLVLIKETSRLYWPLIVISCLTRVQPTMTIVHNSEQLVDAWVSLTQADLVQCGIATVATALVIGSLPESANPYVLYVLLAVLIFPWKSFAAFNAKKIAI